MSQYLSLLVVCPCARARVRSAPFLCRRYRVMMREFRRRRAEEKEKERASGAAEGASGSAPSAAAYQAAAALSARGRARQHHTEL